MTHKLKILPCYFEQVLTRYKTLEYRLNDRGFQKGDVVILREWNPYPSESNIEGYTGNTVEFEIGYVLPVENNYVVFSLLPMSKNELLKAYHFHPRN